ncbi:MAG: diguanylate cyclase [Spirochaetaceae bacterium]|nr:diguanylate cyclase [Spirochaetaceae bacterium]
MSGKKEAKIEQLIDLIMDKGPLKDLLSDIGVFIIDYNGKRVVPSGLWKDLGYSDTHSFDHSWTQYLHPEDRKRVEANLKDLSNGGTEVFWEVYRLKDHSGGWRWIANRGGVVLRNDDGSPSVFIGADKDITSIKQAQEEASHRAREAGTLSATIEVITSSLDLDETVQRILEQARRVVPYDRATVQILHDGNLQVIGGLGFSDINLITDLRFPYPEEGSLSTRAIQERHPWMSNDVQDDFPRFVQVEEGKPTKSWIGAPLIAHGDVIGLISFDSTKKSFYTRRHLELARAFAGPVAIALENARMHGETYKLAMVDALTGIGSRHAFDLNSRFLFEKARREERMISMAMLDLDRFKEVNDDFGHQVGDVVLKDVSRACEKGLRTTDLIARYGGEEIAILLPDTKVEVAADIIERIRKDVSQLQFEGVDRSVTISAGISGCKPDRVSSLTEIIREADAALYRAKAKGRNCSVVH